MDRIFWDYKKRVFWSETTGQQVSIPYVDNFMVSIKEIEKLKDKLHRRNMQIEDLKKQLKEYKMIGNKTHLPCCNALECKEERNECEGCKFYF